MPLGLVAKSQLETMALREDRLVGFTASAVPVLCRSLRLLEVLWCSQYFSFIARPTDWTYNPSRAFRLSTRQLWNVASLHALIVSFNIEFHGLGMTLNISSSISLKSPLCNAKWPLYSRFYATVSPPRRRQETGCRKYTAIPIPHFGPF